MKRALLASLARPAGSRLVLAGSLIGGLSLWACGGEEATSPGQQQTPPPTVASVAVTPSTATLVSLGETVQLTASAQDASGNTISGKTFTWSSSDASISTVSTSGLVTAVANGSATITATTDGVNGTAAVDVNQVATQLAVTVQPTDAATGAPISPAIETAIQDALGSTVADATDAVTVAIGTNPGGGTLSGTTTVNAVAGVASFTDLTIDKGGTGYTLLATSGSLSSATSAAFAILVTVNTFTVTNTSDAGSGSLRQAILDANGSVGPDLIDFNIPGAGPHTIQPLSPLPTISDPVVIDGYTQPGASPNTNGPGLGSNAVLKIELDGTSAGVNFVHGLRITAGSSTVRGLVINRFNFAGIGVVNTLDGNVIEGNFIGTDVTGTVALANGSYGVLISSASDNTIGGTTAEARNVISGNGSNGVLIGGSTSTGNVVQGNFIGTDVLGIAALGGASFGGIEIRAGTGNTIGGTEAGARNVISGNGTGVLLRDGAASNLVRGNFIGTDVTGTVALANGSFGVLIISSASNNTIGGTTAEARNVISGNLTGVAIRGSTSTGNVVQGNFIGTDVLGIAALGGAIFSGIEISAGTGNIIGGTEAGARNVISGNGTGVLLRDGAASNLVRGNFIGTDVTGTAALGNSVGVSITLDASDNTIGGVANGASNTIAFNGTGVGVGSGTGNAVLANSIFSNAPRLGIDLSPTGVTLNDVGDGDAGANNLQNFPVLTSATSGSGSITIVGNLGSTATTDFRLELFANSVCDPSGNGEGETFLGSTMVTTDGSGNASFTVTFTATVAVGQFITATATDPNNNTSEFSQCTTVT